MRKGETVRFVVANKGAVLHEMVLGTAQALKEHAELMKKHPGMEHDEPQHGARQARRRPAKSSGSSPRPASSSLPASSPAISRPAWLER